MRVNHIITRLIVGGAQENTAASVLGMSGRTGIESELISGPTSGTEGSLAGLFAACPDRLITASHLVRTIQPGKDLLALVQLTNLLRARRPDIVHTHSGKAGILGRLAARRAGVRIVVHTVHGPSFGRFQGLPANMVFKAAERLAARFTTHFVTVADAMTRQYLAAGIGRPEQFTRILSGFPLEPFLRAASNPALRARWGLAPTDFVVGKLARLTPLKGHDDLLVCAPEMVRRVPNIRFLLVGDGPLRPSLEARVRALGLSSRFVFTGLVQPSEIPALVGLMDVLIHLSYREGLPRALPQALAAAKPVIAYDCDGAGEVCLDNETGFLIRTGDTARLVDSIARLASDPVLCRRLGEGGRELVKESFSVERMVDALHALYQKLAARTRPDPSQ
jgi:glycosyltransferase involved in cell wall biosynthesis